jgi:hypothetical protein
MERRQRALRFSGGEQLLFKYDFTFAHAITLGYGTFADT